MIVNLKPTNLEARKISFVQEFLKINNEYVINVLEKLLHKNKFEQNLKPMSLEQLNLEIDQSLEDEKNDRLTSAKSLKENIQKWI